MRQFTVSALSLCAVVAFLVLFINALTSPTYQNNLTARYQAVQQTRRVEAQEWGDTLRTWGMWGGSGFATVGGLLVVAWATVKWQEQRTRRHEASEDHTTQRHLISAKRDIVLAYLVQFGEPGAQPMMLNGVRGAYLPSTNEFIPEDICRAELAASQSTALARRQPQTINVPAMPQVGVPGEDGRTFKIVKGDW